MGAKVSFIAYPFYKPIKIFKCGAVSILSAQDIAAMKIEAISQRGRKRDFIDLYWYGTNREPLDEVILRSMNQYVKQKYNMPHLVKSLTYFIDAEKDPMPKLFFDADWQTIKNYFLREVPRLTRKLLF
ncbi:MAG: nucleotidyl transferase AbiEii/AbiGii toxin family protein [Patescibacteria group bacterium]